MYSSLDQNQYSEGQENIDSQDQSDLQSFACNFKTDKSQISANKQNNYGLLNLSQKKQQPKQINKRRKSDVFLFVGVTSLIAEIFFNRNICLIDALDVKIFILILSNVATYIYLYKKFLEVDFKEQSNFFQK
ncbi:hypothetical protein ABPG74_013160 [Tetrahymena malaccensis]